MSYDQLQGLKVLDLGIITAGASTSAFLADLGADVLKIEGPTYTHPFRKWFGETKAANWWNESPQFCATNRNKKSACIDLKSDEGREIFLKLVEQSDLVLENFRVGVLKELGLTIRYSGSATAGLSSHPFPARAPPVPAPVAYHSARRWKRRAECPI